ncbi:MAG: type II toxin-antitoxin system death-on-curing family toxin [Pseudomonadota bacterium]
MTRMKWVEIEIVITIHDRQISRHGGASGLRDLGLLESALNRPQNLAHYGKPRVFELAANYAHGIAKAHAFVDGNKRTAFVTALTFLLVNGYEFRPNAVEGAKMMEDLASDQVDEAAFAMWLESGAEVLK